MQNEYFEKMSEMMKKAQEPFQAIAELNVKTLQNFTYIKPEELTKLNQPEALFEKQLELAVSNGHKALDYMQKSFQIIEKAMCSCMQQSKAMQESVVATSRKK